MKGRALIDLLQYKLACGQYGSIPNEAGASLVKAGAFDPKATLPGQVDHFPKQKGKSTDPLDTGAGGKDDDSGKPGGDGSTTPSTADSATQAGGGDESAITTEGQVE